MSFISKLDILDGRVIVADMVRRIIGAFDGTLANDIKMTGAVQINQSALSIDGTSVTATATNLNGLAGRTAGITAPSLPLIVDSARHIDFLSVDSLAVSNLLEAHPAVSNATGKIFAFNAFS